METFETNNSHENSSENPKEIDTNKVQKSIEEANQAKIQGDKEQKESSQEADLIIELADVDFNTTDGKIQFFKKLNETYNNGQTDFLERSTIQDLSNSSLDIKDYREYITNEKLGGTLVYDVVNSYKENGEISLNDKRVLYTALSQKYENPLIVFGNIFGSEHNIDFHIGSIYNKVSKWIGTDLADFMEDKIKIYSNQKSINQYDAGLKDALQYSEKEIAYIKELAQKKGFDLSNFKVKDFPLDYGEIFSMIIRKGIDEAYRYKN